MVTGLVLTPRLMSRQVSIEMKFEPSAGILARKVEKLGLDIRSFREPLKRSIREVMIPSIRKNFDTGGRPAWEPLAESTVMQRGSSEPILVRTGKLRRVATQQNIWHVDREKALVTQLPERVWYGGVHQAGHGGTVTKAGAVNPLTGRRGPDITEAVDGSIPARPFIMIQDEDVPRIHDVFDRWLAERISRAGLR